MAEPSRAVFLSYASQDSEAAARICAALRTAGIEVWFDRSELRGGDAWDRQIRRQIHDCALFIAVISAHSNTRSEGYFRREWKLAVERTADMAEDVPFLIPVAIDDTVESMARVPDRFREVQWTQLPDGETPAAFVERVLRLLSSAAAPVSPPAARPVAAGGVPPAAATAPAATVAAKRKSALGAIVAALAGVALIYLVADRIWLGRRTAALPPAPPAAPVSIAPARATNGASGTFAPPPHSLAVLPFANLSGDKSQDYFSDGLTEELLNSLAEIEGLQVAARTSSFYFKGEHVDLATVAHKLNVAAVLEGSVRRSAHKVRVTAQLINAITGFHLWSKTYDRDLGDVLKLQSEIATAVASSLKVTLLGDVAARIAVGGTHNPTAFDAYLRGNKAFTAGGEQNQKRAMTEFSEAIRLDPAFALAFAFRSMAYSGYANEFATVATTRENFGKALVDARQAISLAPELAEGQLAMAFYLESGALDFTQADQAYARARALAPGNARVLRNNGYFAVQMGRVDVGLADLERAVVLDPLNPVSHRVLGFGLFLVRRYREAVAPLSDAISLESVDASPFEGRGFAYYFLGDFEQARASCEAKPDYWGTQWCLAIVYDKLGRRADAERMVAKMQASLADASAYQYATIYARWGDARKALEWLDTAMRLRDPGLEFMKMDPLMDPLRAEPRFKAALTALKFPP